MGFLPAETCRGWGGSSHLLSSLLSLRPPQRGSTLAFGSISRSAGAGASAQRRPGQGRAAGSQTWVCNGRGTQRLSGSGSGQTGAWASKGTEIHEGEMAIRTVRLDACPRFPRGARTPRSWFRRVGPLAESLPSLVSRLGGRGALVSGNPASRRRGRLRNVGVTSAGQRALAHPQGVTEVPRRPGPSIAPPLPLRPGQTRQDAALEPAAATTCLPGTFWAPERL